MASNVIALADYPADRIRLACRRCHRRGEYPKAKLIGQYGAGMPLPDLRVEIAHCDRHGALGDACGVYFVDLAV